MFKQRFPHITTLAAYGCSFVGGGELGDHILSPDAENIKRRKGADHWWNFVEHSDPALLKLFHAAEQAGAWPKLAADLLNLTADNQAVGGTSLGLALWLFQEDLRLARLDPKTTLYVFGVTTPLRIQLFKPNSMATLTLGNPQHWCERTITDIFTDAYILWNHLQLLERISMLAKRWDLTIAVFNMFPPLHPSQSDIAANQLPLIQHQHDYVNQLPGFFLLEPSMSDFIRPEELLAFGHPNAAVHARFAEHVIGCLNRL